MHALIRRVSIDRIFHSTTPLPPEIPRSARSRIEILRELAAARRHLSLRGWLQQIRKFLPNEAYLSESDREGLAIMRNDRILQSFCQEVEAGTVHPLVWLLQQRSRATGSDRWDVDLGEDVVCQDEGMDAVRVMTIHKAKGLESRFVIIFGWQSVLEEIRDGTNRGGSRPILTAYIEGRMVRCFRLPWGPIQIESPRFREALHEDQRAGRSEAARLAYVAATRARDGLILLSPRTDRSRIEPPLQNLIDAISSQYGPQRTADNTLEVFHTDATSPVEATIVPASLPLDPTEYKRIWQERSAQGFVSSHLLQSR